MARAKIIVFFVGFLAVLGGIVYFFSNLKNDSALADDPSSAISSMPYHRSVSLDKNYYDNFFSQMPTSTVEEKPVISGVIPHHLVAGKYLAQFFSSLQKQNPPVVVLLGPNHPGAGRDYLVSSFYDWKTPYGNLSPYNSIIQTLVDKKILAINEDVIDAEFSIGAPVPFIKKIWPSTQFIPIIVKENTPTFILDRLAVELSQTLPSGSLVLTSIDFSHYQPYFISNFHDVLSENILATGDLSRISKAELDSHPSLYFLLKYNALKKAADFHLVAHSNSALIAEHPQWPSTTSHLLGYYTAGPASQTSEISMQFFGDVMLDRNVAKAMGKGGLNYLLGKIRGGENRFFAGADLFMANLEGPFAKQRIKTSKSIAFRFDPTLASQLKQYNFGAVTLANNHSLDMGKKNELFTEETLATNGIKDCGQQLTENSDLNLVLDASDNFPEPVAFVCVENVDQKIDKKKLTDIIESAKAKARYVIVQVHGGTEYSRLSTTAQRDLYHFMIDQGVTAVIGHHPHVVEEVEVYKGKPIVYSLGNFIFDQYFSKDTQEGLSVGLVLADGKAKELHFFPFFGVNSQVQLMMGKRRADFLTWMQTNSRLGGKQIVDGVLNLE